jgi:hypothetical protein
LSTALKDLEAAVKEFRLHDVWSKTFSSYSHLTKEQRHDEKVAEMLDFLMRLKSDHEHLKVMLCLNKLLQQTLVTNIETGSKIRLVTCSERQGVV